MSKLSIPLCFALCFTFSAFSSCKTNNVVDTDDGDLGAGNQLPDLLGSAGGSLCRTPHAETLAPMGGSILVLPTESPALAGTTLSVPAGALNGAAKLSIGCGQNLAAPGETIIGASARLLPEGQVFIKPVRLTLPFDASLVPTDSEIVLAVQTGGQRETISGSDLQLEAGSVSADISHFSDYQVVTRKRPGGATKNVDVLFLMDNSPSMTPKQRGVAQNIAKFIQPLEKAGLDYQLGIATSDVGSQVAPGMPWGGAIGTCDTYEGDDGALQNIPCDFRSNGTSDARNACNTFCADDKFVPTDGKRFISRIGGKSNVPQDLIPDPMTGVMIDNGPVRAFQCIGLVGDGGCGIEGQLEGARRALDGHRFENAGFPRKDSLLAVIFVTDEDDCSVQLARRNENNPMTHDCATPDQSAAFDCYNVDYRCLARSITCDQPMNSTGVKSNCKERPGNYLEPLAQYASFLRGLRSDSRLLVAGIWTQPSISSGGHVEISRATGTMTPYLNRSSGTGASCSYSGDSGVYGQAQLRLSAFAKSIPGAKEYSVCDIDNLGTTLGAIAQSIVDKATK